MEATVIYCNPQLNNDFLHYMNYLYYCVIKDFLINSILTFISSFDSLRIYFQISIVFFNILLIYVLIRLYKKDKKVRTFRTS